MRAIYRMCLLVTTLLLLLSGGLALAYSQADTPDPPDDGAKYTDAYLQNPGNDSYAVLLTEYAGMSRTLGRPALVDAQAGYFPKYTVKNPKTGTMISGKIYAPDGSVVSDLAPRAATPDLVLTFPAAALSFGLYRVEFELINNGLVLYDQFYFTAVSSDDFTAYRSVENAVNSFNANVANTNPDSVGAAEYPAVFLRDNKLAYAPDYKGNRILDYSGVGYQGGLAELPDVPVAIRLSPLADPAQDAYRLIQDAIDTVSALPLQADGFRGAVYLEEGVFRISAPLYIRASGVVLRGAGAGENNIPQAVWEADPANASGGYWVSQLADQGFTAGVTKLIATWTAGLGAPESYSAPATHTGSGAYNYSRSNALINVLGGALGSSSVDAAVIDQYVGAGQFSIHVADVNGFEVGDLVSLEKAINTDWVYTLNMDLIDDVAEEVNNTWLDQYGNLISGWRRTPFQAERTIKAIDRENNTITFHEPLADSLDRRYGVSMIKKIGEGGRICNVGIEGIMAVSHFYSNLKAHDPAELVTLANRGDAYGRPSPRTVSFKAYTDENHALTFVTMENVRDAWLRNFVTWQLDVGFLGRPGARNVTVTDGAILDPVSQMSSGSRRYAIHYEGIQFALTQQVYARYNRHAFAAAARVQGPNVFYNCQSNYTTASSEPHYQWSAGGLYDNVTGSIIIHNRWSFTIAHGWAGASWLMYNCVGQFTVSQSQLAPNYLMGHLPELRGAPGDTSLYIFDAGVSGFSSNIASGRIPFQHNDSVKMSAQNLNGGKAPNFPAYELSPLSLVGADMDGGWDLPLSLYRQQLKEKHDLLTRLEFSGVIRYQPSFRSAKVELKDSADINVITETTTDEDGAYILSVPAAPAGTLYTLTVTKPGYLSYTVKNFSLTEGEALTAIDISRLAGDVNGDGIVNSIDLTYLLSEFNRAPLLYPYADIDGDDLVNSVDLTYLLAGFNKRNVVIE